MKIQIASDLHFELSGPFMLPDTDADVLVLAGDIGRARLVPESADLLADGKPCVIVAGNHEFYRSSLPEGLFEMEHQAARLKNVYFLENATVEINGVVFLGCTLWSDMRLFEPMHSHQAQLEAVQNGLNDYRLIQWQNRRLLQAADTISMHRESVRWLEKQFEAHRGQKVVVVTHHAPSMQSIAPNYLRDLLSAGFASRLDDLVESSGAALWIHGHTHGCCDYRIGPTRVVANSRGYRDEHTGFNPALVVEV